MGAMIRCEDRAWNERIVEIHACRCCPASLKNHGHFALKLVAPRSSRNRRLPFLFCSTSAGLRSRIHFANSGLNLVVVLKGKGTRVRYLFFQGRQEYKILIEEVIVQTVANQANYPCTFSSRANPHAYDRDLLSRVS